MQTSGLTGVKLTISWGRGNQQVANHRITTLAEILWLINFNTNKNLALQISSQHHDSNIKMPPLKVEKSWEKNLGECKKIVELGQAQAWAQRPGPVAAQTP